MAKSKTAKQGFTGLEGIISGKGKIIGHVESFDMDSSVADYNTGRIVGYVIGTEQGRMNPVYQFTPDGRALLIGFVEGKYAYKHDQEGRRIGLLGRVEYYAAKKGA